MPLSAYRGRIIDAHNHPDWHGHSLERFLANMDAHGIAQCWLFNWICPPDEFAPEFNGVVPFEVLGAADGPIPFARCLSYRERAPDRFILGYAPDPRRAGALDRMQAAIDIYGARLCGELKLRMMYDNPDALDLYRYCGERGVPVTVHLDYPMTPGGRAPRTNYWYGGGLEAFARAVRRCPETTFLGHAPGFWAHISGDDRYDQEVYPAGPVAPGGRLPELLRECPNLYCDISAGSGHNALSRDPAFGRAFILEFQDRVLYARDYFDNRHQALLEEMDLPGDVLDKVLFGNARRLAPDLPAPAVLA